MYKMRCRINYLLTLIFLFSVITPTSVLGKDVQKDNEEVVSSTLSEGISDFELQNEYEYKGHPVYYYVHKKSGAQLVFEKNNNIDKKFEIAFRTPPVNDKGINHIIEHSVLHGSTEYAAENVFMNIQKRSYHSFMNAMTYPDYTCYPIASKDEDEFNSLARIYTSCVLFPKFLSDKSVFEQEGVRFSINKEGKPEVNGTVFNEVKEQGAITEFRKNIFPDTQDKNISGGQSIDIMDLTYEEVCEMYKKYYHPANSVIVISGDVDINRVFKWLSEDYLNNFDKKDFKGVNYKSQYPVKNETYNVINFYKTQTEKNIKEGNVVYIFNGEQMKYLRQSLSIISKAINDPNSNRVKAVKDKGYIAVSAEFVELAFFDPIFVVSFASDNPELMTQDALQQAIDVLFAEDISKEESDKYSKNNDFDLKILEKSDIYETNIPSNDFVMSFVRFGNPISDKHFLINNNKIYYFNYNTVLDNMKILVKNASKMGKKFLVFNPVDDEKLSNKYKIDEKINNMFENDSTKFSEKTVKHVDEKKELTEKQKLEAMFKKLSDIQVQRLDCPLTRERIEDKDCFFAKQDIGKYIKYKIGFKVNHLSKEQIKYLFYLPIAFNQGETLYHTRNELEMLKSGKMSLNYSLIARTDADNKNNIFIIFDVITDSENLDKSFDILYEQIFDLKFKDKKIIKDSIYNMISNIKNTPKAINEYQKYMMAQSFNENSYILNKFPADELLKWLEEIYDSIESDEYLNELSNKMKDLVSNLINRRTLYNFGICTSDNNVQHVRNNIGNFTKKLVDLEVDNNKAVEFVEKQYNKVAFVDKSITNSFVNSTIDLGDLGKNIEFAPLCKIVTEYFLIPKIREENGAYGAAMLAYVDKGKISMSSWNDPNFKATLDIFSQIPTFLENYELSSSQLENICKNSLDTYLQNNKLDLANNQLFNRMFLKRDFYKIINSDIEKIKNISLDKIKSCIPLIKDKISNQKVVVLTGNLSDTDRKNFDFIVESDKK